jgi:hypothetical protein
LTLEGDRSSFVPRQHELEAEELCGLLRVLQIRSICREATPQMNVGSSSRGPVEVLVDATALERAQQLLSAK